MGSNIVRFQSLLNRRYVRETEAVEILEYFKNDLQWENRAILRESLIALGMATKAGWQPQEDIGEVQLTKDLLKTLRQLQLTVKNLASLDFSQAHYANGELVDPAEVIQQLNEFDQSATSMLGEAQFFEVDDDE